ncbi:hypothetical protein PC128_g20259 [Phytophthora cactorum]|nr:hypothetical protein PC128_g20259 [Phytophthora cactorum]
MPPVLVATRVLKATSCECVLGTSKDVCSHLIQIFNTVTAYRRSSL